MKRWISRKRRMLSPQPSTVDFGDFLSPDPVSEVFGFDRGTPIDRYYIDRFLAKHRDDITGAILEVADDTYATTWGEPDNVAIDILHHTGEEGPYTIIGDLTNLSSVTNDTYDCVILTQVLQFIFDLPAAVREIHRILKPSGVCLATFNGISQVSRFDMDRWGEYWRLTDLGARRLFEAMFDPCEIEVLTYGNALSATAFLQGLGYEELSADALDRHHTDYQVLVALRAAKQPDPAPTVHAPLETVC